MARRCNFRKRDGSRCRAFAVEGSPRCCFHDPDLAEERAEGRRRGGLNRNRPSATLPPETPALPLKSVDDVVAALAETMNLVRTGRLAVNVGNCLFVGAGVLLRAIEGSDLERRIADLEASGSPRIAGRRIA